MADSYERILHVAQEVFVYSIPPRVSTTRAVRAADWNLASPDWKGRLKIVSKENKCVIKLEERSGELFAVCPVDAHPGVAVEPVSDSSRYFVLKLQESSGRHAFVGMGFQDRSDSFDFNVALQDFFKGIQRDLKLAEESTKPQPHVDYSLKAGQKISLNISKKLHDEDGASAKSKPKGSSSGGILLPPPPSGSSSGKPVAAANTASFRLDKQPQDDDFGDFLSGGNTKPDNNWVQF